MNDLSEVQERKSVLITFTKIPIVTGVLPFRFIYAEVAYFSKWWDMQSERMKQHVKMLVRKGQLEFISGGWSNNDEAATHYHSIIDQLTWGLR